MQARQVFIAKEDFTNTSVSLFEEFGEWYDKEEIKNKKQNIRTFFCRWAAGKFLPSASRFESALDDAGLTTERASERLKSFLDAMEQQKVTRVERLEKLVRQLEKELDEALEMLDCDESEKESLRVRIGELEAALQLRNPELEASHLDDYKAMVEELDEIRVDLKDAREHAGFFENRAFMAERALRGEKEKNHKLEEKNHKLDEKNHVLEKRVNSLSAFRQGVRALWSTTVEEDTGTISQAMMPASTMILRALPNFPNRLGG